MDILQSTMFFSSNKEINRLIVKGMSNIYYWENWGSQNFDFLGKKIWRNALALRSWKVQGKFGVMFILALSSSDVFRPKIRVSDFF